MNEVEIRKLLEARIREWLPGAQATDPVSMAVVEELESILAAITTPAPGGIPANNTAMPDPTPHAGDFLNAERVVDHLLQNLAIDCDLHMAGLDRETMQRHVNRRAGLIHAKIALLDEAGRLLGIKEP